MRVFGLISKLLLLSLFAFGCATIKSGASAPILKIYEDGTKIQGRWVDPKNDSINAFNLVKRNETTLEGMKSLGFDPEAKIIGGIAKNEEEMKNVESSLASKPTKLEGPEAYKLYEQMLFPSGTAGQVITEELREKRRAEIGNYSAYIFVIENVKNQKDRLWFSTQNKLKVGFRLEFKFILKNEVVVEKDKKEEHFNDPSKESSFGKGAIEALQGIKSIVPIPIW